MRIKFCGRFKDVYPKLIIYEANSGQPPRACSGDSRNPDSKPFSVDEFMSAWRQCEKLVDKGLVRYIGISNMTVAKLNAVLPLCRVLPAALETELPPSFQQPELFAYALKHDIQGHYRRGRY